MEGARTGCIDVACVVEVVVEAREDLRRRWARAAEGGEKVREGERRWEKGGEGSKGR